MIRALIGDLFRSKAKTLVNTVNCVGVMGKGVAQIFKSKYRDMYDDYRARCAAGEVRLGEPYLYQDLGGVSVLNFPTKDHWKSPTRLADIEAGLDYLLAHYKKWGIESIAFPPLGCGNGGLEWEDVGPLMYSKLIGTDMDIVIYAPFGTSRTQLTAVFLAQSQLIPTLPKGRQRSRVRPGWVALFEAVRRLQDEPYASPVGRTILQKIGFVLTDLSVPTELEFGKGSFGPFSADMGELLTVLANKNWWVEEQLGSLKCIRIQERFRSESGLFREELKKYESQIAKTVDLFCRIKSTVQAEEVATVLYATRRLTEPSSEDISEKAVFDYILDWKSQWDTEQGRAAITEAIRSLEILGWIRLSHSEVLA